MLKKCTIIGWYGFNNIGDEFILSSLLTHLKEKEVKITVISANPSQTKRIHKVDSIPISPSSFLSLRNSDLVIFGGGQIFSDWKFKTIPQWSIILFLIKAMNCRGQVILLNQGIEVNNLFLKDITRRALSGTDYISVRDKDSYNLLNIFKMKTPYGIAPDIVFSYKVDKSHVSKGDSNKPTIGVNLRPPFWWKNREHALLYHEKILESLDYLIDELNVRLVLIPFRLTGKEPNSDEDYNKNINHCLINRSEVSAISFSFDDTLFSSILDEYQKFDIFIGTALHSLILSCKMAVPFLAFTYQKKCENFMQETGLSEYILKQEELLDKKLFLKRVSNLLDNKKYIKEKLLLKENDLSIVATKTHIDFILEKYFYM